MDTLELPIHLTCMCMELENLEGTTREPQREHANWTQKGPRPLESNPQPSCFEATALTTATTVSPRCLCLLFSYLRCVFIFVLIMWSIDSKMPCFLCSVIIKSFHELALIAFTPVGSIPPPPQPDCRCSTGSAAAQGCAARPAEAQ